MQDYIDTSGHMRREEAELTWINKYWCRGGETEAIRQV